MMKLKGCFWLMALVFLFWSCKKEKDKEPEPVPPPATSQVSISVVTYDSLGAQEADFSGVSISLYQTSYSAITGTSGSVSFSGVPQKSYVTLISKNGYDAAQSYLDLTNQPMYTAAGLPVAKKSPFQVQNFAAQPVSVDSINVSFKLHKAVPSGKQVKVAFLMHTNLGMNALNHSSADIVGFSDSNVVKFNIAKLPNFKSAVAAFASGTQFYVSATSVSYGSYLSNFYPKAVLLGDNVAYPSAVPIVKNW